MKRWVLFFVLPALLGSLSAQAAPSTELPMVAAAKMEKLEKLHQKAEEQIALNEFRPAMDTYQEILFLEPDDEVAYVNMGRLYLMFSDFKHARTSFENALSIDPENESALRGLRKIKDPDAVFYPEKDPDPPARSSAADLPDPKS